MSIARTIFRKFNFPYTPMNLFRGIAMLIYILLWCSVLIFWTNYSDFSWKDGLFNICFPVLLIIASFFTIKTGKY